MPLVMSEFGLCTLLRCKMWLFEKWLCDKRSLEAVMCKNQSFGRCTVRKLALYSPRPRHTPLQGLRLIVCHLMYEEQLIHAETKCKKKSVRSKKLINQW